jgi:hypothetical protein
MQTSKNLNSFFINIFMQIAQKSRSNIFHNPYLHFEKEFPIKSLRKYHQSIFVSIFKFRRWPTKWLILNLCEKMWHKGLGVGKVIIFTVTSFVDDPICEKDVLITLNKNWVKAKLRPLWVAGFSKNKKLCLPSTALILVRYVV